MTTTGTTLLADIGTLAYNGVVFSALTKTQLSGDEVKDEAGRTVKQVDWTLTVDAFITLNPGETAIDTRMQDIKNRLSQQAGVLKYTGRGFGGGIQVNGPGGVQDLAWGPRPEVLEFQPWGQGRSASIKWQVRFSIPQLINQTKGKGPLVQFNEEIKLHYDEKHAAYITIDGTMEIGVTRTNPNSGSIPDWVDRYRQQFLDLAANFNLQRFRVTRQEFNPSRDKRVMEWGFTLEQIPWMGLPPGCPVARGNFSFRPAKPGLGMASWICTLRATYTVRQDYTKRMAWWAFLSLVKFRMEQSAAGSVPAAANNTAAAQNPAGTFLQAALGSTVSNALSVIQSVQRFLQNQQSSPPGGQGVTRKAWLINFEGDEGLYLDSDNITFSASWMLITTIDFVLLATGLWRTSGLEGGSLYEMSVRDISGWKGVLPSSLGPGTAIVDLNLGPP